MPLCIYYKMRKVNLNENKKNKINSTILAFMKRWERGK